MTDEQKLQRINDILDVLVEVYFRSGELPLESAYAWSVIARAHLEELRGIESATELIDNINMHPNCYKIIIPDNNALQKHLLGLFELRGVVADSLDNRNTVLFVQQGREGCDTPMDGNPYLHLVPPSSGQ